jgi:hypothetical protein
VIGNARFHRRQTPPPSVLTHSTGNSEEPLYIEATRRGLRLKSAGDKLAVIPKGKCTPEFADVLRQHKQEILSLTLTMAISVSMSLAFPRNRLSAACSTEAKNASASK